MVAKKSIIVTFKDISCPACGAAPYEQCISQAGSRMSQTHPARRTEAKRLTIERIRERRAEQAALAASCEYATRLNSQVKHWRTLEEAQESSRTGWTMQGAQVLHRTGPTWDTYEVLS